MSALHQLKQGLNEVWGSVREGWERLYQRAAGAITRYTPGKKTGELANVEMADRSAGWGVLAAEVYDDDNAVTVRLEAPGMKKGDFDIEVVDDYLVVRGEKRYEKERKEGRFHVTECADGVFERAVPLPAEVDVSKAKARDKRGVLSVTLPKTTASRRRRITVDVG
jgi:HSP20 family protein